MGYKVGNKFIIEIAEVFHGDVVPDTAIYEDHELYRINGFNGLVFDENGLNKLEKYEKSPFTLEDCNRARIEGYQEGLDGAWEAAMKIIFEKENGGFLPGELREIFKSNSVPHIFAHNTATEAISKIKAYEEQKKAEEEIKVGDEVLVENKKFVVLHYTNDPVMMALIIDGNGNTDALPTCDLIKTGRHFDIDGILKAIREE